METDTFLTNDSKNGKQIKLELKRMIPTVRWKKMERVLMIMNVVMTGHVKRI